MIIEFKVIPSDTVLKSLINIELILVTIKLVFKKQTFL